MTGHHSGAARWAAAASQAAWSAEVQRSARRRETPPRPEGAPHVQAFDRIAHQYDALWTTTPVGRAQRDAVWRVADRFFLPGQRVLDIGCGTGVDALHLMERGLRVRAIDASPEMIAIARSRGVSAIYLSAEELSTIRGSWDGVLSNFGALNCVRDLESLADALADLVRPGGHAVLCLLNPACAWELARRRRSGMQSLGLHVEYPSARQIESAFASHFGLIYSRAIGLFVPPSRIHLSSRLVRIARIADRLLAGLPGLRSLGDHRLYVFRRLTQ